MSSLVATSGVGLGGAWLTLVAGWRKGCDKCFSLVRTTRPGGRDGKDSWGALSISAAVLCLLLGSSEGWRQRGHLL